MFKPNKWIDTIRREVDKVGKIPRIMEVCGTHTMALYKNGLKEALEGTVKFISGPGCPVCITPQYLIDNALTCAIRGHAITAFGDIMRVTGSNCSLMQARSEGADIRVVTSPLEVLEIADALRPQKVTFFAIGFETTAPGTGLLIKEILRRGVNNITILTAHRFIPPALHALFRINKLKPDGLLGPGHVAAITGIEPFVFVSRDFKIPCVISGFEPEEILQSVLMLILQVKQGRYSTEIQYIKAVQREGNIKARNILSKYFFVDSAVWRGLGVLPGSGLFLRDEYSMYNENLNFKNNDTFGREYRNCHCDQVLCGIIEPNQCPMFYYKCFPSNPLGPCMVSSEGACRAAYLYFRE